MRILGLYRSNNYSRKLSLKYCSILKEVIFVSVHQKLWIFNLWNMESYCISVLGSFLMNMFQRYLWKVYGLNNWNSNFYDLMKYLLNMLALIDIYLNRHWTMIRFLHRDSRNIEELPKSKFLSLIINLSNGRL